MAKDLDPLSAVYNQIRDCGLYSPEATRRILQYLSWVNLALEAKKRGEEINYLENLEQVKVLRMGIRDVYQVDPQSLLPPGISL